MSQVGRFLVFFFFALDDAILQCYLFLCNKNIELFNVKRLPMAPVYVETSS